METLRPDLERRGVVGEDRIDQETIESEVDAENVGKPVPASVVNPLVATVAARAAKG